MTINLDQATENALRENTAQTVFKNLRSLENQRERFKTRWVWELLQNARDSAQPEGVKIAFLISEGQLVFRHSGKPFTKDNLAHLIYHGSSKLDENDPIGQFGTGFISTHLISKIVQVRGSLDGTDFFNFTLDRSGISPNELQVSMDNSKAAVEESSQQSEDTIQDGYSTEYIYQFSEETIKDMVEEGMEELRRNAGFILAFNDALQSLHLVYNSSMTVFQKIDMVEEGDYCSYVKIEERDGDGNVIDELDIGIISDGSVTTAVSLKRDGNGRTLSLAEQIPRLYVAFPLLGTEEFSLPCIVNSTQFKPTDDRDGIFLTQSETEDITKNRALLEKGIEQASSLLAAAAAEGWRNGYRLAALGNIVPASWLDRDWYRDILTSVFLPVIRSSAILPVLSGKLISPAESWIPIWQGAVKPSEIWSLASGLKVSKEHLPVEAEVDRWSENLSGWAALIEQELTALDEAFGISRLTRLVSELSDITQLTNALEDELDTFQWLKNLYRTLFAVNQTDMLDEYAILPDQTGKFRYRNDLRLDRLSAEQAETPIDEILKDISEGLGTIVRSRLLDRRIDEESIMGLLQPLYQEELVTELADRVREQEGQELISEEAIESNVGLFAWALQHGVWKVIEGYPVITRGKTDDALFWQTLSRSDGKKENRLLAPLAYWPEVAHDYFDLFPARFIIRDAYFESCPETEYWDNLVNRGYIFAGPLFWAKQRIKIFLPDEPLPETDDDETRRSSELKEVSKIAFLTTEDIGIVYVVRNSKRKAIRFLEFLLRSVLEIDQSALETAQVMCENGETHTYYKAEWLGPVKHRKWVPIGDGKQDHINPVSLGSLIKDSPELMSILTEGRPALLMQALGVSISALSLQALADEEDDRVSLIRSLAVISEAAGGSIEKIEELASELKEDPELLAKIEQSRENRKRVAENQRVGALVEEIFKEMLEDKGFVVKRTGIGSDYSVESDVVVDGEESGLSIQGHGKKFLVEIKATRLDAVRMTITQMKTAVENKKEFVVCYVQLQGLEPDRESVENQCRFIFDIGSKVEGLWQELSRLRMAKAQCSTWAEEGDLKLEIDELGARLRIGNEAWESGNTLAEAISFFSGGE